MPVFFGIAGLNADLTVLRDPTLLMVAGGLILGTVDIWGIPLRALP
jgi:Kef-type K+ transport system membrane component KefB